MGSGRLLASVLAVLAVAGCSVGADRVDVTTGDPSATASYDEPPSPTSAYVTSSPAGPSDLDVFGRVRAFAVTPDQSTFEQIPFADVVALGLGEKVERTVPRQELTDAAEWTLDQDSYGGRDGPFSAVETLRAGGEAAVVSGPHNHCASPPRSAPAGLESMRRISAQPTGIDSCINWWSVDLFVDSDGRIVGILLDLWDP